MGLHFVIHAKQQDLMSGFGHLCEPHRKALPQDCACALFMITRLVAEYEEVYDPCWVMLCNNDD